MGDIWVTRLVGIVTRTPLLTVWLPQGCQSDRSAWKEKQFGFPLSVCSSGCMTICRSEREATSHLSPWFPWPLQSGRPLLTVQWHCLPSVRPLWKGHMSWRRVAGSWGKLWLAVGDLSWSLGFCQVNLNFFSWFGKPGLWLFEVYWETKSSYRLKVIGSSMLNFPFKYQILTG